jgi:DNA-binding NtrC family response regulator
VHIQKLKPADFAAAAVVGGVVAGEPEAAVLEVTAPVLDAAAEPSPILHAGAGPDSLRLAIGTTVEEAEKVLILRTLEHTKNNKTRAAEILGISLKTLHNKLKEYGTRDT